MPSLVGQTLSRRYRVDRFLGRGGMAEVYQAWDAKRSVHVALKVLNEDLAEDFVFLRRFAREARALELLQHPNIVRFFGFEESQHLAFLVMEYIGGTTLRRQLKLLGRPLTLSEALTVLKPVCGALHYAHGMGVFHCDIKPGNIFIERGGRVVLGDFGIARLSESVTVTHSTPGTPAYMAPEQCRGEDLDGRTDIYGLGITAYEMLTLDRPFKGDTEETTGSRGERVRWQQMNVPPPRLRSINPELPETTEAALLRALEKEPSRRQQGPLAFYDELSRRERVDAAAAVPWIQHEPEPKPEPQTIAEAPPARQISKRLGLLVALGVIGALLPAALLCAVLLPGLTNQAALSTPTSAAPPAPTSRPTDAPTPTSRAAEPTEVPALPTQESTPTSAPTSTEEPILPTPEPTPPPTSTPLPTSTPTPESPFPPDITGRIAFTRNPHGHQDSTHEIYVLDLADGGLRRLTNNSVVDWDPHWSPDGTQIAFVSFQLSNYDIWTMRSNGSQQTARITLPAWDDYPVWAPDGSRFAIASTGETDGVANSEIFVGSSNGNMQRVTFNEGRDEWPSWSPDGRQLACSSDRDGDMDIYLFSADGGNIVHWTDDPAYDEQPAWSPDGEWIAFIRKTQDTNGDGTLNRRDDGDFGDVWVGRRDGTGFRQLTYDSRAADPAWSPNGRHIVFTHARDSTGDGRVGLEDASDLWVVPVSGGDPIVLTGGPEQDWSPDWTR